MKTVVLIDGANIYQTSKNLEFDIDYSKLKEYFFNLYDLRRIYYFTALREIDDKIPLRPLIDWLSYHGFCCITKPAKVTKFADGREKIKGNMDVEIAVVALEAAKYAEKIVLVTGDGDFRYLVETLQRNGVIVTVVSSIQTDPVMIADELRRQADEFLDLSNIQLKIEQEPRNHATENSRTSVD